jgi:hypothetical protein
MQILHKRKKWAWLGRAIHFVQIHDGNLYIAHDRYNQISEPRTSLLVVLCGPSEGHVLLTFSPTYGSQSREDEIELCTPTSPTLFDKVTTTTARTVASVTLYGVQMKISMVSFVDGSKGNFWAY